MLVIGIGLLASLAAKPNETLALGEPAPDFSVELLSGETFTLSTHLRTDGRPVILNLWASWCIPCRTETPELSEFARTHPEVKLLGVAVSDTEAQARRFAEEFMPFHDLAFGDSAFEERYPTLGLPATIYIGSDGTVGHITFGIVTTEDLNAMVSG